MFCNLAIHFDNILVFEYSLNMETRMQQLMEAINISKIENSHANLKRCSFVDKPVFLSSVRSTLGVEVDSLKVKAILRLSYTYGLTFFDRTNKKLYNEKNFHAKGQKDIDLLRKMFARL